MTVTKPLRAAFVLISIILLAIFLRIRGSFGYLRPQVTIQFGKEVDWTRFAYIQYVTNTEYLCNSVMLFEALHRLDSKPDRLMMYPDYFSVAGDDNSREAELLRIARDKYKVKLKPIQVQSRNGGDSKQFFPAVYIMAALPVPSLKCPS